MQISIVLKLVICGVVVAVSILAVAYLGVAGFSPFARLATPFAVVILCVLLADSDYFHARSAAWVFPSAKTRRNLSIFTLVLAALGFALMLPLALRTLGK